MSSRFVLLGESPILACGDLDETDLPPMPQVFSYDFSLRSKPLAERLDGVLALVNASAKLNLSWHLS